MLPNRTMGAANNMIARLFSNHHVPTAKILQILQNFGEGWPQSSRVSTNTARASRAIHWIREGVADSASNARRLARTCE